MSMVPSYFLCPILKTVLIEPVIASDERTYEGEAIRKWIQEGHDVSPIDPSRKLRQNYLVRNINLEEAIKDYNCQESNNKRYNKYKELQIKYERRQRQVLEMRQTIVNLRFQLDALKTIKCKLEQEVQELKWKGELIDKKFNEFSEQVRQDLQRRLKETAVKKGYSEINEWVIKGKRLQDLQILNLSFKRVQLIQRFDVLTNLKELYLNHNQIQKIQNLDRLTSLQTINLSFNLIQMIENLNKVRSLKYVYLWNNPIQAIQQNKNRVKELQNHKVLVFGHRWA